MHNYPTLADPAERDARLKAFWAGESLGRPALSITAKNPAYVPEEGAKAALSPKESDWSPEAHGRYAKVVVESRLYYAEAVPHADTFFGSNVAILPVLMGADYDYGSGTAWVHPVEDILEREPPKFDPQHPLIRTLDACMEAEAKAIGRRGFVNTPVAGLDSLTALSLLRGAENLCMDLLEEPERVEYWAQALTDLSIAVQRHFQAKAVSLGYGENSCWYEVTAPGLFQAVQCDMGPMLSPEMFERFAMPELRKLTEAVDYSLYHLDGTCQTRFFDLLETLPRLNGIQWNPEPPAQQPRAWFETFRDIRRRGWLLLFNQWECRTVEDAIAITEAVGPDGLFLSLPTFETPAEAEAAVAAIERACRKLRPVVAT